MTEEIEKQEQTVAMILPELDLFDGEQFKQAWQLSEAMSRAKGMVPETLLNNPGGCLAVVCQAKAWGIGNPFAVARCAADVHGSVCYEGKLVHAVLNKFIGAVKYEFFGDWDKVQGKFDTRESQKKTGDFGKPKTYNVPAWKPTDERGVGVKITAIVDNAACELDVLLVQCQPRNSTLWATDPQQQICYAGIRKFARRHTPGLMLGVYTPDERDEEPIDITPPDNDPKKAAVVADIKSKFATPADPEKAAKTSYAPTVDEMCKALGSPPLLVLGYFKALKGDWHVAGSLESLSAEQRRGIIDNADGWKKCISEWVDTQDNKPNA